MRGNSLGRQPRTRLLHGAGLGRLTLLALPGHGGGHGRAARIRAVPSAVFHQSACVAVTARLALSRELFAAPFGCPARGGQPFSRLALGTLGMHTLGGFLARQAFGHLALVWRKDRSRATKQLPESCGDR